MAPLPGPGPALAGPTSHRACRPGRPGGLAGHRFLGLAQESYWPSITKQEKNRVGPVGWANADGGVRLVPRQLGLPARRGLAGSFGAAAAALAAARCPLPRRMLGRLPWAMLGPGARGRRQVPSLSRHARAGGAGGSDGRAGLPRAAADDLASLGVSSDTSRQGLTVLGPRKFTGSSPFWGPESSPEAHRFGAQKVHRKFTGSAPIPHPPALPH